MSECLRNSKAVEGVSAKSMAERPARVRGVSDGHEKTQADSESVTVSAGRKRLDTLKQCWALLAHRATVTVPLQVAALRRVAGPNHYHGFMAHLKNQPLGLDSDYPGISQGYPRDRLTYGVSLG